MNVASLNLCQRLYELSKWDATPFEEMFETETKWMIFVDKSNIGHPYLMDGKDSHYKTHGYDCAYLPLTILAF